MVSLRSHLAGIALLVGSLTLLAQSKPSLREVGRAVPSAPSGQIPTIVTSWLNAQTNIQTWSADVKQIRTLKTLTQPLNANGHVWFAAPNQFRWEIGKPPQTIAIRRSDEMLVIYPRLKRVERYSFGAQQTGPWKDTSALLEAGFLRNESHRNKQFKIIGLR